MPQYNVEFFSPEFEFRHAVQTEDIEYELDYLDVVKNKIKLQNTANIQRGDYILMTSDSDKISGVVSDISETGDTNTIEYKPFHKIFDQDVFYRVPASTIEETLAGIMRSEWIENPDLYQNINGLRVEVRSETAGNLDVEQGVNNFFEMVLNAFTVYQIVCDFRIDVMRKEILCSIEKISCSGFKIEAELKNVLNKEIYIEEASNTANKVTVYNSDDLQKYMIFYRQSNDEISMTPESRVLPVIHEVATCRGTNNVTFEEAALAKAMKVLNPSKNNNMIKIKVQRDDLLVLPAQRKIGEDVLVLYKDKAYSTILTGWIYKGNEVELIFGTIRLELTKQIKKRWRMQNVN